MPATGKTALRTGFVAVMVFSGDGFPKALFHGMAALLMSSFPGLMASSGIWRAA
jgi:hypothetical protein